MKQNTANQNAIFMLSWIAMRVEQRYWEILGYRAQDRGADRPKKAWPLFFTGHHFFLNSQKYKKKMAHWPGLRVFQLLPHSLLWELNGASRFWPSDGAELPSTMQGCYNVILQLKQPLHKRLEKLDCNSQRVAKWNGQICSWCREAPASLKQYI